MRKTLALLVASTALTTTIGWPAWSAMNAPADKSTRPLAAQFDDGIWPLPLILASDDNEDDDDEECDDDDCNGGARGPAPVGTVAPLQNRLFRKGTPPRVQMN